VPDDLGRREELLVSAGDEDVDHGGGQRPEDVDDRGARRALPDRRDELHEALLAPGEREVLLRREVVEDRLLGDVGGGRDLGDGDAVEAALGEEPAGRGGDGLASGALLACAKAFVLCA
jgi:hypothetical protein